MWLLVNKNDIWLLTCNNLFITYYMLKKIKLPSWSTRKLDLIIVYECKYVQFPFPEKSLEQRYILRGFSCGVLVFVLFEKLKIPLSEKFTNLEAAILLPKLQNNFSRQIWRQASAKI